ncbi:MAG: hypothetical protein WBD07_18285 [Vicinamibacterales bacterium]
MSTVKQNFLDGLQSGMKGGVTLAAVLRLCLGLLFFSFLSGLMWGAAESGVRVMRRLLP